MFRTGSSLSSSFDLTELVLFNKDFFSLGSFIRTSYTLPRNLESCYGLSMNNGIRLHFHTVLYCRTLNLFNKFL